MHGEQKDQEEQKNNFKMKVRIQRRKGQQQKGC
jgi:hypothetical protein